MRRWPKAVLFPDRLNFFEWLIVMKYNGTDVLQSKALKRLTGTVFTAFLWFICTQVWAASNVAGDDRFSPAQLINQYGNSFEADGTTGQLLLVRGMTASKLLQQAISAIDTGCLKDGSLIYVADISGMPGFVSKMFAIPKIKKYGYPVWLDISGEITAALPAQEDQVSLMTYKQGVIENAAYFDEAGALSLVLIDLCGTASRDQVGLGHLGS
jgi:hypothetical protein